MIDIICGQCGVLVENTRKERKYCVPCAKIRDKESKMKYYRNNKHKQKKYREDNKEKISQKNKKYRQENLEELRKRDRIRCNGKEKERRSKYGKEYYKNNREKVLKREALRYRKNPDLVKQRVKQWCAINKDKVREQSRIKRVRKASSFGSHTIKEFYQVCEEFNWECCYCGERLVKRSATEDHVIPLVKGGTDLINNIVPACRSCNSSKQDQDLIKWYPEQDFFDKAKQDLILDRILNNDKQLALF
jgi:5-methylcytosine-specific restriction endonuclease McrA